MRWKKHQVPGRGDLRHQGRDFKPHPQNSGDPLMDLSTGEPCRLARKKADPSYHEQGASEYRRREILVRNLMPQSMRDKRRPGPSRGPETQFGGTLEKPDV